MACSGFKPLLITLGLVVAACDGRHDIGAQRSITVKLPPAQPQTPAPGFSIDANTVNSGELNLSEGPFP
jgi:hypothetical protein